jgi:hypothetical protein
MRNQTSVPIPEVFPFDASLENELGVPFVSVSFVAGISAHDSWFDKAVTAEELAGSMLPLQGPAQKVWKYAKPAPKQVTGGPGAKIIAPGEVAPKNRNKIVAIETNFQRLIV